VGVSLEASVSKNAIDTVSASRGSEDEVSGLRAACCVLWAASAARAACCWWKWKWLTLKLWLGLCCAVSMSGPAVDRAVYAPVGTQKERPQRGCLLPLASRKTRVTAWTLPCTP
jgi:hypothetical protein